MLETRAQRLYVGVAVLLVILLTGVVAWQMRGAAEETSSPSLAEARPLDGEGAPLVGQIAPDFEIVYPDGSRQRLSDLRGRPVLINFWATWCGPCRVEMPEIERAYLQYQDQSLVVLAVNLQESPAQVQAFVEELAITFPVVLDPQGDLADRYQIRSLPSSLFIGRDGVVAVRWIGLLTPEQLEKHLRRIL